MSAIDADHEPIPVVPWANIVKTMTRLRRNVGATGFIQAFISVASSDGAHVKVKITNPRTRKR